MENYLFIAEKPSLMRDIQTAYKQTKTLSYNADFMAFHGHFMELQEPGEYRDDWQTWNKDVLPMIPDKFQYKIKKDCVSDYKKIKAAIESGKYDYVVNACDAGREGQAIFWTTYEHMGCKVPVKRIWASDNTVATLASALANLRDEATNEDLINMKTSSFYRAYFDWLTGMNFTRAISLTVNTGIPVGRVMSPTLAIVVDRDLAIKNFKPKDYFEIEADFDKYKGSWFDPKTNDTSFDDKAKADALVKKLGKTAVIDSMDTEKVVQNAPALHSLTELQKDASKAYGFTANQTLDIAQKLYEDYKVLSYPRTESRALSTNLGKEIDKRLKAIKDIPDVKSEVSNILADKSRIDKTMKSKRYVDNAKITDHHAIIPTETVPDLSIMKPNEIKVYMLVVKRFVSIFMDPYVTNKTTIITDVDGEKFKTVGSVLVDYGYKKLYDASKKDDVIPAVSKGDTLTVKKLDILAKKTTPPKPLTDADLLTSMTNVGKTLEEAELQEILKEKEGLGTTATRAGIIEKLVNNKMIERKGKVINATDFGIKVIELLRGKDIISPILTAEWEKKLRAIESGDLAPEAFYSDMLSYVEKETKSFDSLVGNFSSADKKKTVCDCPACGGKIIESPKAFYCSNWKKDGSGCSVVFSRALAHNKQLPTSEAIKILSGKESKQLKFTSKAGKEFTSTLIYDPNEKIVKYNIPEGTGEVLGKCPLCGGDVVDKGGYMRCSNGDSCKFGMKYVLRGANFTLEDCKNILSGKGTDVKKFDFGEAKITGFDKATGKFNFEFPEKVVGKCPCCGKDVVDRGTFIQCKSNSKDHKCFSLANPLKGAKFNQKDFDNILSGKETDVKKFQFGQAKIKFDKDKKKLEFIFSDSGKGKGKK